MKHLSFRKVIGWHSSNYQIGGKSGVFFNHPSTTATLDLISESKRGFNAKRRRIIIANNYTRAWPGVPILNTPNNLMLFNL